MRKIKLSLQNTKTEGRWVSVSEGYPEVGKYPSGMWDQVPVIICCSGGWNKKTREFDDAILVVGGAQFTYRGGDSYEPKKRKKPEFINDECIPIEGVTHWMQMPDPPRLLQAKWTMEPAIDLKKAFGMGLEKMLVKCLNKRVRCLKKGKKNEKSK